ncbi:porin family protein [uncultured Duncaniella sp.]|nr:porin family protein [uncultured Duncaniella sp.]
MKRVLFLLVVAFVAMSASAQITWNTKGGIGLAHCWGDAEGLSGHFVGKIGAGIEKPLTSNWSLMPSLEVAWKGAEEKFSDKGFEYKGTLDLFYIQVPVVAAYRVNINDDWNCALKAGPYLAYAISGKIKGGYEGESFDEDFFSSNDEGPSGRRFDAGLDFGVDFEYHRFVFGVEYELGFISIQKKFEDIVGSIRNAAFYATVGFKF